MTTLTHRAPTQIIAGDTIEFLVAVPADYQSWTPSARLTGVGQMDATSVALEGDDFHVKFQGQGSSGSGTYKTALLAAGQYVLTIWATNANDRRTIAQFPVTITPDLSTGTPALAHALKMLTAIETAIENRLGGNTDGGVEEYTIDGTMVKKLTMQDLQRLRNKYADEVKALQNPNAPLGRVRMTMSYPGYVQDLRTRND